MKLPPADLMMEMYKRMFLIRAFEDRLYLLFLHEAMPGTMHQYNGQEAVAVGVCSALNQDDYIVSTHRGHGHYIAKGGDIRAMMAEMFAKATGCCRGMGGSMHIMDLSAGILGSTAIVGAGIPIAAGAALSAKLRATGRVSVSFFGDGAANTGAFHEAMNLAAVWDLPVIFVCENNLYGFSTPLHKAMKVPDVAARASGYGMPGVVVDGNDCLAVWDAASGAVERARAGKGPTLIECKTYRFRGHSRFEPATYRSKEELETWLSKDPIPRLRNFLIERKVASEKAIASVEDEVKRMVEEAVEFARKSPEPEPDAAVKYVFAEDVSRE